MWASILSWQCDKWVLLLETLDGFYPHFFSLFRVPTRMTSSGCFMLHKRRYRDVEQTTVFLARQDTVKLSKFLNFTKLTMKVSVIKMNGAFFCTQIVKTLGSTLIGYRSESLGSMFNQHRSEGFCSLGSRMLWVFYASVRCPVSIMQIDSVVYIFIH